ncbi:hypothetical protein LNP00_00380 [Fructobacillus sp. M158]|uniref:hypothetical protein n=1 Tax=Fructobacillus parabroussonetiae TaxID=2713174 RepID=UPI00200B12AB|nr:hypothetical protein [Fructobacillus parabroussonetiae]MCK8616827.1 hypothetical protein [Fructobacillus parabroussonetiae]
MPSNFMIIFIAVLVFLATMATIVILFSNRNKSKPTLHFNGTNTGQIDMSQQDNSINNTIINNNYISTGLVEKKDETNENIKDENKPISVKIADGLLTNFIKLMDKIADIPKTSDGSTSGDIFSVLLLAITYSLFMIVFINLCPWITLIVILISFLSIANYFYLGLNKKMPINPGLVLKQLFIIILNASIWLIPRPYVHTFIVNNLVNIRDFNTFIHSIQLNFEFWIHQILLLFNQSHELSIPFIYGVTSSFLVLFYGYSALTLVAQTKNITLKKSIFSGFITVVWIFILSNLDFINNVFQKL